MATCSTHVLDAALGRPAAGVVVRLSAGGGAVEESATDADGRLRFAAELATGPHRLTFATGAWFATQERATFFGEVNLDFEVVPDQADEHHHVALLLSPFAYTTYRGS